MWKLEAKYDEPRNYYSQSKGYAIVFNDINNHMGVDDKASGTVR